MNFSIKKGKKPEFFGTKRIVNSREDCIDLGCVYATKQYDMFEVLKNNRGSESENSTVTSKQKRINQHFDRFKYPHMKVIRVNHKFKVIDGHHTLANCKETGDYVLFMFMDEPDFNSGDESKFFVGTAIINSISPLWTGSEQARGGSKANLLVCKVYKELIDNINTKLVFAKEKMLDGRELNISKIISIAQKYPLNAKKGKGVPDFIDTEIATQISSDEFLNEVLFCLRLYRKIKTDCPTLNKPFDYITCLYQRFDAFHLENLDIVSNIISNIGFDQYILEKVTMQNINEHILKVQERYKYVLSMTKK